MKKNPTATTSTELHRSIHRENYTKTTSSRDLRKIPLKPVTLQHGEPYIKWSEEEVAAMDVVGNLQHVVVGKFSYGWPKMEELRSIIPTQCNIKGDCHIGLFRNRHALIRLSLKEDFINVTSKVAYYLKSKDGNSYQMRSLIYDSKFKLEDETTRVIAWISSPYLLPTYYVKESSFFLATIVGTTLHLDIGTINKTQLSCAKGFNNKAIVMRMPLLEAQALQPVECHKKNSPIKVLGDLVSHQCVAEISIPNNVTMTPIEEKEEEENQQNWKTVVVEA
ncbi:hypothetical protein H5410_060994 [Solanum commersonii]|uniref:DUF4283 domain-containing protein n=1 Tax=Solanum commersonii TaxID=4109 RepID=A0A9J5W7N1_SOLCO|nr:hypothetical protein H5410_060994 [Solanum commersonii]